MSFLRAKQIAPSSTNGDVMTTVAGVTAWAAASGGGGGSLTVQDENGNVGTAVTQIDFQGAGVTATAGTGEVVVTIPGGGGTPQFWDDVLTAIGSETTLTLGQTPLSRSERIWKRTTAGVEKLLDRGADYTIGGAIVSLSVAMLAGEQIRDYYAYASGATGAAATLTAPTSPPGGSPYSIGAYSVPPFGV